MRGLQNNLNTGGCDVIYSREVYFRYVLFHVFLLACIKISAMVFSRKTLAVLMVAIFVWIGIAATKPPEEHKFKNLKVLPKDISMDDLDKVMDSFKAALGVKCGFCHAPSADSSNHHLDFASDAKPEKEIARKMMKMTEKINHKFFKYNKDDQGKSINTVECMTCHHGKEHPGN
jgi:Photosynthetic reaction centre cytochrome C subunit